MRYLDQIKSIRELAKEPLPPQWLIRGVIPASGVVVIQGDGSGVESLFAFDLAMHLSSALPDWFGYPIRPRPNRRSREIILSSTEHTTQRWLAWGHEYDKFASTELRPLKRSAPYNPADSQDTDKVIRFLTSDGVHGQVLFVDAKPDLQARRGVVATNLDRIAKATGGLVVVVDRTDDTRLTDGCDTLIRVSADGGGHSWVLEGQRNALPNARVHAFEVASQVVGDGTLGVFAAPVIRARR